MRTVALQTAMDTVLGRAAGNGLEVTESVETLEGGGPADLVEVTVALAREMVALAGSTRDDPADVLASGRALPVWRAMVAAQGGDPDAPIPTATEIETVRAAPAGVLTRLDARAVGELRVAPRRGPGPQGASGLAVGRRRVPGQARRPGRRQGDVLLELHVDDPARLASGASTALDGAFEIGDRAAPATGPLVLDRIGTAVRRAARTIAP